VSDEKMKNIAIGLLVLAALINFLFQKKEEKINLGSFAAIAVIFALALVAPMVGMILAIPIFLVVYLDHSTEVLGWWDRIKRSSLNLGGGVEK
jgi:multisubunit Na+/H+ antiporter MnhG subunit